MFSQCENSRDAENGNKINQNEKKKKKKKKGNDKKDKQGAQTDHLFLVIKIKLFKRIQTAV